MSPSLSQASAEQLADGQERTLSAAAVTLQMGDGVGVGVMFTVIRCITVGDTVGTAGNLSTIVSKSACFCDGTCRVHASAASARMIISAFMVGVRGGDKPQYT